MRRNHNFEVSANDIHIEAEIGEGAFGRVYRATVVNLRHIPDATVVAVKQLKSKFFFRQQCLLFMIILFSFIENSTPEEEMEFLDEIKMLQDVGTHNNIVCFLGCCTLQRPYFMIMEHVGRGDLVSFIFKR